MPTIDDTITLLERTFRFIQTAQKELDVLKHYEKQPWYEDERSRLEGEVRNHSKTLVTALETFDRYPGRHSRHFDKHARADWSGLLNAPFDWKDPGPGIAAGLGDFLPVRAAAGGP